MKHLEFVSHDFPEPTMLVSGRFGDEVFSVRHGEMYRRKYVKPKQPNTAEQEKVKTHFALAVKMAKAADMKTVPRHYRRKAMNTRAGGRMRTSPSRWNAVVSSVLRGGLIVRREGEALIAIITDARPHIITATNEIGDEHWITIAAVEKGEMKVVMPDGAVRFRIDNSRIKYVFSKLKHE